MRKFFHNLEQLGVRYLLISGQASVLYGAAQFSEDIDLWLSPTWANIRAFLVVLEKADASVYKLTPPLNRSYLLHGHGFHFRLPEEEFQPAYLDFMGCPPRVGPFSSAFRRASRFQCDWGNIPVVAIPDLIELKKTRRAADYDVISNLVKIHLRSKKKPDRYLLLWGLKNVFRVEDALWILDTWPETKGFFSQVHRSWLKLLSSTKSVSLEVYGRAQSLLSKEIGKHQLEDVRYWSTIIQELRELRKKGMLIPEGTPVADL